jgi:hypothetical protein
VIDIVEVLTGSSIPKRYWSDLKRKLIAEAYEKIVRLKIGSGDVLQNLDGHIRR